MFYRPQDGHPLPHNPFNAIVTPRPIGWISTRDAQGRDNIAPYSFFNGVAYTPPQVMFASTGTKADIDGTKDSMANIRDTPVSKRPLAIRLPVHVSRQRQPVWNVA